MNSTLLKKINKLTYLPSYPSGRIVQMHIIRRNLSLSMISKKIKVQVKQGVVVGEQKRLPNGNLFTSFKGIPYAVPPVGSLRFKSPVPLDTFPQQELDCTKEGDVSHQRDPFTSQVVGSENCLFLNVYVPQNMTQKLPVMVWIHGGGFFFGSGNTDYFFPQQLMDEDVIVVTLNYRLGALGFLCLPEENIFGNAGLKDQRLALQWVKENISNFNGDPENVTLFGESAGAASVHLHVYARHAKELFHKAIMQSGTANMEWVFQTDPVFKVRKLAELLGCTATSSKDIIKFLQSDQVTPLMLLSHTLKVLTPEERRCELPFPFKPIVESVLSPDSFINQPILETLQKTNTIDMPLIMGYNSAEGIAMIVNAIRKLEIFDKDLERYIPRNLEIDRNSPCAKKLTDQIREFYFGGQPLSKNLLNEMTNLLSDYHFIFDMQLAAEYHSLYQHQSPLYFYIFEYVGSLNMYKKLFQMSELRGACHGDELFYLFQMLENDQQIEQNDSKIIRKLCRLWTNFSKFGNPTPKVEETLELDSYWTPVSKFCKEIQFELNYLAINTDSKIKKNPDHDRIQFWRNIYKVHSHKDYSGLNSKL